MTTAAGPSHRAHDEHAHTGQLFRPVRARRSTIAVALAAAVWGFAAIPTPAVDAPSPPIEVNDNVHHWTLTLPEGWGVDPSAVVALVNERSKSILSGRDAVFTNRFSPRADTDSETTFVLTQQVKADFSSANWEDIRRALAPGAMEGELERVKDAAGGKLDGASIERSTLDQGRGRIVLPSRSQLADGRVVRGVSYGMLGSSGITYLHCYALESDFPTMQPRYERLADSFRFHPGWSFIAASEKPGSVLGRAMIAGGVGALVAILIFAVRSARTLVQQRQSPPLDPSATEHQCARRPSEP